METTTRRPALSWKAMAALLIALPVTPAWACTTTKGGGDYASIRIDIPIEKADAPYGEVLSGWMLTHTTPELHFVDGCDRHARIPFRGKLDSGGLRSVGSVVIGSYQYTTFEMTGAPPTSPLLVFQHYASTRTGGGFGHTQPVWDINDHYNPGFNPPAEGVDGRGSTYYVALVARGGAMASLPLQTVASFVAWPEAFPALKVYSAFLLEVRIPRATCTLANQVVTLPDVQAIELQETNSYARETPFVVNMTCNGADTNMVRVTIKDGMDPSSTGTELTPSNTSTAQGVRLQLVYATPSNHNPLRMGTSWQAPVSKGSSTIKFLARYYRTTGAFRSGTISSGATLTLSHF